MGGSHWLNANKNFNFWFYALPPTTKANIKFSIGERTWKYVKKINKN